MELKKGHYVLAILLIFAFFAYQGGYLDQWIGAEGEGPFVPTQPEEEEGDEHGSASIQWTLRDGIGGSTLTSDNEYVDTCVAGADGTFDLTEQKESTDNGATQENSDTTFAEGSAIIFHCSSDKDLGTTGTDHYDMWYYLEELKEGEPVRVWDPSLMEVDHIDSSGTYHYRFKAGVAGEETGYVVQWNEGTTPYWNIGVLKCYPRTAKDDITFTAYYSGTALCSETAGSSFDSTTTGAADATLTDTDENLIVTLEADATSIAYGLPMYTITAKGKIETRPAFIIVATNMTAISVDGFTSEGWHLVEDSTLYAEKAFYKVIDPQVPLKGESFSYNVEVPVDSSAAASDSGFYFKVWLIDFQLEENVQGGSPSTSIPTAYGMINEFGLDAVIYAQAFSASSGVAANQCLSFVLDTPA
jgi:hypothetical protein